MTGMDLSIPPQRADHRTAVLGKLRAYSTVLDAYARVVWRSVEISGRNRAAASPRRRTSSFSKILCT
jgi:hypothetical protein